MIKSAHYLSTIKENQIRRYILKRCLVKAFSTSFIFIYAVVFFFFPSPAYCADTILDGSLLSAYWAIPFAGLLFSIALWPLINPHFWEEHYGKITFFWSALLIIALLIAFGAHSTIQEFLNSLLVTYFPFIILLTALFTVTGGIHLRGDLTGTPSINTAILFLGAALASWMGTTGASMLLIRPLLRANIYRKYRVHTVIFFIILVANIGGALTPLGDPPIFLGFLAGIDFFWSTKKLFLPMVFLCSTLLFLHYCVDLFLYKKEKLPVFEKPVTAKKLSLEGWELNFPLLVVIAGAVLLSGIWKPGINIPLYGQVALKLQDITRDGILLSVILISGRFTPIVIRERNSFTWDPMREVAKLFIGIFICLIPVIAILKAGHDGAFSFIISLLNTDGKPDNMIYFWLTGVLSTFLDNAPTFLVFFNIAGGDAQVLMTTMSQTMLAITCGTVFMGANTYISNAPNLMVRSMAENMGIRMPSFFVYLAIVVGILFPLFGIFSYLWLL